MGQAGLTELEVEYILEFPLMIRNSYKGRKIAIGLINNRKAGIVFEGGENYLKIITIID